jgi:hypothetical protein
LFALLGCLLALPSPSLAAEAIEIGTSQGGQPLEVYRLGEGDIVLLLMGGQHGAPELNTTQLTWALLEHFEASPHEIPEGIRIEFMPEANPDGLAAGSRQFLSGVDPNRNWGTDNWAPDAWDSNGQFRLGLGGPEPFSEQETQAVRAYLLRTRPALTVNYHSRGGFLFGGRTDSSRELGAAYSSASGYRLPQGGTGGSVLGYRATGSMNVWMGQEGLAGLLVELATSNDPELARNLAAVRRVLELLAQHERPPN